MNKLLLNSSLCCRPPSPLQFGGRDLGYSFLGSGGEPTQVVVVGPKFEEQKSEDEAGAVRRGGWCGGDRRWAG